MNDLQRPLSEMLRSCVECGLCLPHCATYLASGNEVQSPRGRLLLLGDLLNSDTASVPDSYLAAFDQCIGCRACETTCPSGVPYSLLEHGQQLAAAWRGSRQQTVPQAAVPDAILKRLDSPKFLRMLGRSGRLARGVCESLWGTTWRRKLDRGPAPVAQLSRLLSSLPSSPHTDEGLVTLLDDLAAKTGGPRRSADATAEAAPRAVAAKPLSFFRGCANAGLLPATSQRLVAVLETAGFDVSFPTGQQCCGALAEHTGQAGRAAGFQRRNREAFGAAVPEEAGPIVVEAAGCGLELKSYGPDFTARVVDAVCLLSQSDFPPLRSVPLRVVFHDPCHARHGQGITAEPRQLLAAIPDLTWLEATEKEVCCGSGGAWGLRYPQMSAELARRKAADLAATGADLVVTTNPGCLGQIADGLALAAPELPILPLTDLWWYAARQLG